MTYLLVLVAGMLGGMLLAQCFVVLASRTGGNFGGEVIPLLALPLFICAGYAMGRDHRQIGIYDRGYRRGYSEGKRHEK